MPDIYEAAKRSQVMARVRSQGTVPERRVRDALADRGLEYEVNVASLPGKPDLVIPAKGLAMFVHGCWWHRHDCIKGSSLAATRAEFWRSKIARNVQRDGEAQARLETEGWKVAVIWECETSRQRLSAKLDEALS